MVVMPLVFILSHFIHKILIFWTQNCVLLCLLFFIELAHWQGNDLKTDEPFVVFYMGHLMIAYQRKNSVATTQEHTVPAFTFYLYIFFVPCQCKILPASLRAHLEVLPAARVHAHTHAQARTHMHTLKDTLSKGDDSSAGRLHNRQSWQGERAAVSGPPLRRVDST